VWWRDACDVTKVRELKQQMRRLLNESGVNVIDLIKKFDSDASCEVEIDDLEFYNALRRDFGFKGSMDVADELFAELDVDHGGHIGFDELYQFVKGRRHSLDKRHRRLHEMGLAPSADAGYTLDDIAWDGEVRLASLTRA
jgi:Ca2+-binding EF-hand superfamily protein